jgi:hypothetical protein
MSITHSVVVNYNADGVARASMQAQLTGSASAAFDESIADSSTDEEVEISFPYANLQALRLISDQDVTIETNDGSAADDTITLEANVPLVWWDGCGHANPFSADVTSLFITNASGSSANVKGDFLWDAIP